MHIPDQLPENDIALHEKDGVVGSCWRGLIMEPQQNAGKNQQQDNRKRHASQTECMREREVGLRDAQRMYGGEQVPCSPF